MRLPALFAAAALTFAAASPAIAATTTATAPGPVELVLIDVSDAREAALTAIDEAEGDEEALRDALTQWRLALLDASDELTELRTEAKEAKGPNGKLTKKEEAKFDEAREVILAERAEVRELRAELFPEDEAVVIPAPIEGLGGILGTTALDIIERSEQGDKRIIFGVPGGEEPETTEVATTTRTPATEPAPAPTLFHRAERMQESTTTETSTSTSAESSATGTTTATATATATETTTPATTTTAAETTTSAATTTSSEATTSATAILQNRTTSASTTTSSTTTSPTTSSSVIATIIEDDEDDERDDDLAETGTPMLSLIVLGALATLAGLVLVRRAA